MRKYLTLDSELYNSLHNENQISLSELKSSCGTASDYINSYTHTNAPKLIKNANSITISSSEIELIIYNIKNTPRTLTKVLERHPDYTYLPTQEGKIFRTHAAVVYEGNLHIGASHVEIFKQIGNINNLSTLAIGDYIDNQSVTINSVNTCLNYSKKPTPLLFIDYIPYQGIDVEHLLKDKYSYLTVEYRESTVSSSERYQCKLSEIQELTT